MRQVSPEEFEEAVSALDEVRASWLKRPGVNAVDVGLARTEEGLSDELAIRVYVDHKKLASDARPGQAFPSRLGKFPVSIIEATFGPQHQAEANDPAVQHRGDTARGSDG